MQTIAVIDYGMGNLRSVSKALEAVAPNHRVVLADDPAVIASADRVVCPGQGAARECMQALSTHSLDQAVLQSVLDKPFLGICMGLQVLLTRSEENNSVACLDVFPGSVKRFSSPLTDADGNRLKVPHMGWSPVMQRVDHPLWQGIDNNAHFYFAHSYYCSPQESSVVAGTTHYGLEIAVALHQPGIFACQFHPEKSSDDGLQLLRNFVQWDGQ